MKDLPGDFDGPEIIDTPMPINERLQQIHNRLDQIKQKVGQTRLAAEISGNRTVVGHYIDDVTYLLMVLKNHS